MNRALHRASTFLLVGAVWLVGCDDPLLSLPADLVVHANVDVFPEGGFAGLWFETSSCLQLAPDTRLTFNDAEPLWFELGGRDSNPLSAYISFGCGTPNANWDIAAGAPVDAPFVFAVSSGETSLSMEIADTGEVTTCDFPSCFFDTPPPGRAPDAP